MDKVTGISIHVMAVFRPYLALVLSLVLILTGISIGSMRGQSAVAEPMVLCTGAGPVTVFLNENGEPTQPPHICPDCVLNVLGDYFATETFIATQACGAEEWIAQGISDQVQIPVFAAHPRGPPAVV